MAKKKQNQNQGQRPHDTSNIDTDLFIKGMIKDSHESFVGQENWTHARNAINNSIDGDTGVIGNEPANLHCAEIPYIAIGAIHMHGDQWAIFSTDNTSSEIGLFDDSKCKYQTLVNQACLNFNQNNLITGVAKENFECKWQLYWDDDLNPSRTIIIDDEPYLRVNTSPVGAPCTVWVDGEPTVLD